MNILILLSVLYVIVLGDTLYDKLHISRSATSKEIRAAYKREAALWHPDKNPSKSAQENFIEITNAYQVLSNPRKRAKYDAYGVYGLGDDNFSDNPPSAGADVFANFFGSHFYSFSNLPRDENVEVVTFQTYREKLLFASRTAPLMILSISHFCFICQQIRPLWSKIAGQYSQSGVIFGITNIQDDQALREELNVLHSPSIVTVIDGKVSYFMQSEFTETTLVEFLVRALLDMGSLRSSSLRGLPSTTLATPLMTPVKSEAELNVFLSGWLKDSRPRALFVKAASCPPLHFCVAAFRSVDFYASGFLDIGASSSRPILQRLSLSENKEGIMIFHESPLEAVTSRFADRLSRSAIDDVLMRNSRLAVPRLLNSAHFLDLCPANDHPPSSAFASASETASTTSAHEEHTGHRHLCLTLLLQQKHNNDNAQLNLYRSILRPFIPHALNTLLNPMNDLPKDFLPTLSPVYIFVDRQGAWINNVTASSTCPSCLGSLSDLDGRLLALWRVSSRILAFRLLPQNFSLRLAEIDPLDVFAERLKMTLTSLLVDMTVVEEFLRSHDPRKAKSDVAGWSLSYLPQMEALFVDELAAPLWLRIRLKLWNLCRAMISYFDNMWADPVNFFLTSEFTFILIAIIVLYRVGLSFGSEVFGRPSPSSNSDLRKQFTSPDIPYSRVVNDTKPKSLLLTPSTYHRLVLASPKGQFSIFLCTDASPMGQRLADQFYHICHRYGGSTNVPLVPACLFLDRYADWLGWALEAATRIPFRSSSSFHTPNHVALTFNPDNCRGTVLAVNGYRRYFHIYHPLLPSARLGSYKENSEYEMEEKLKPLRRRNLSKESRRIANFSKMLGLNRSSDDESDYDSEEECEVVSTPTTPLLEHEVLAGLSMWFDRLFEGSLRRYHVGEWPQHLTFS